MFEERIKGLKRRAEEGADRKKRLEEQLDRQRREANMLVSRLWDAVRGLNGLPMREPYTVRSDGVDHEFVNAGECRVSIYDLSLVFRVNNRTIVTIEAVVGDPPSLTHDDTPVDLETAAAILISVAEKYLDD